MFYYIHIIVSQNTVDWPIQVPPLLKYGLHATENKLKQLVNGETKKKWKTASVHCNVCDSFHWIEQSQASPLWYCMESINKKWMVVGIWLGPFHLFVKKTARFILFSKYFNIHRFDGYKTWSRNILKVNQEIQVHIWWLSIQLKRTVSSSHQCYLLSSKNTSILHPF